MIDFYTNFFSDEKMLELKNCAYPQAEIFEKLSKKAKEVPFRKRSPRSQVATKAKEVSSKKLISTKSTSSRIKRNVSTKTDDKKTKSVSKKVLPATSKAGQ